MTDDSPSPEALAAAAKKRAEFEKNVRQQMIDEPDYWQFVYAYAFSAMESAQCLSEAGNIKGLTLAQTILFLSAVTTLLEIISGKSGLEIAKKSRQIAVIGGWELRDGPDSSAAEAYLLRETRGYNHPKTAFTLAFSHPADPFAVIWIDIHLDAGSYGFDHYQARMSLPEAYYEAANAFLSEGELGPNMKLDRGEPLDPKTGRRFAKMRIHSNSGRDGWARRFSGDICKVPFEAHVSDVSMAGFHVVFEASSEDRLL